MARKFHKLTSQSIRALVAGQRIIEHGIEYERLPSGDGVFRVNVMIDGRRIHRTLGRASEGVTPQRAWGWIAEMRFNAATERLGLSKGRKTRLSFQEAASRYLEELARLNGKDLLEKHRRLHLHLMPFFGHLELCKINSLEVERYKRQRREEPSLRGGVRRGRGSEQSRPANEAKLTSSATVNRELAVLSHLLNRAVEWGWIASRPVRIARFSEPPTRFEYLTSEEIARLITHASQDPHPYILPFVVIALHSAMRAGEILSLRREQVDLDKQVIHLPRAKTGARDVPVSRDLAQYLERYLKSRLPDSEWLFPAPRSKCGHTREIVKPWDRVIKAAGLAGRHITRHTLRHTAITHLVQAGVDLPTVQRISGHKTFQMVFRYAHQNQQHVQDALSKLDGRIAVDPGPQGSSHEANFTRTTQVKRGCKPKGKQPLDSVGRPCRDRTYDQRIKSPRHIAVAVL